MIRAAPQVHFLPIVVRELRVVARRPGTYYRRMLTAALWVAVAAYVLIVTNAIGFRKTDGREFFRGISIMLFIWAIISSWRGSDSISAEKREGTIGFLFLTDLKSHDIVLGKMAASALPSFYAMLAALPLLAICMVMGGVMPAQYAKTALAILDALLLGQAIGVFSSALCRLRGNATGLPFLIFLFYIPFLASVAALADHYGWLRLGSFLWMNNPARPLYLALSGAPVLPWQPGYWLSLLVAHLHTWIFVLLATWVLPKTWREKHKRISFWRRWWEQLRYGNMTTRASARRHLLDIHPFTWVACRRWLGPPFIWSLMGIFVALMGVFAFIIFWDANWANSYRPILMFTMVLLQLMIRMGIPAHAALLEEHRRNGFLETILCCSPLSPDQIIEGTWLVLRRYHLWPVVVTMILHAGMIVATLIMGSKYGMDRGVLGALVVATALLIPDLRAMAWVAMWGSMANRRPQTAASSAFSWICILPWLPVLICCSSPFFRGPYWVLFFWPVFALTNDFLVCWIAKRQLRKNFRLWSVPSQGDAVGLLGSLGRLLGLFYKRLKTSSQPQREPA